MFFQKATYLLMISEGMFVSTGVEVASMKKRNTKTRKKHHILNPPFYVSKKCIQKVQTVNSGRFDWKS